MRLCAARLVGAGEALSITSLELAKLPVLKFQGRVAVIRTPEEDRRAAPFFAASPGGLLGLDSEAKPSFGLPPHRKHRTAIVQVATEAVCCIWHVHALVNLPATLGGLLRNPALVKVAQGAVHERASFHSEFGCTGEAFLDLHELAAAYNCHPRSLQGLCGIFLQRRMRKEERCSDWERNPLTQEQVDYAAADAFASLVVLRAMRKRLGSGETEALPAERLLEGPLSSAKAPISLTDTAPNIHTPTPSSASDALRDLMTLCTGKGFVLKAEGFESAPGGFRAILRVTTATRHHLFRSQSAHASIRSAQKDAALSALQGLHTLALNPKP